MTRSPTVLALAAIALWGSLALLSLQLSAVPPFLLVGVALLIGAVCGLPWWRSWKVPASTLLLGCYGIFGYHFCLFMALRFAPPVEANLINYLWPLLMVLLAPVVLPGVKLSGRHVAGGVLGLAGCGVVLAGGSNGQVGSARELGLGLAFVASVMWSTFSLLSKRVAPYPTGALGGFCLASGVLALLSHAVLEEAHTLSQVEWLWLVLLGVGPMGTAFFLWDAALKAGDARSIGTLAYITPLLSTSLLGLFGGGEIGPRHGVALLLILGGAWLGNTAQGDGA